MAMRSPCWRIFIKVLVVTFVTSVDKYCDIFYKNYGGKDIIFAYTNFTTFFIVSISSMLMRMFSLRKSLRGFITRKTCAMRCA